MALTILEGSAFCLCDDHGDIGTEETSGFFSADVRFLSGLRLTVNGERPLLLVSGRVEYFSAAFYLRNPIGPGLKRDMLLIVRERFVGRGMEDRLTVRNQSQEVARFELGLDLAADFADMFTVKDRDFALGNPDHAKPLPPAAEAAYDAPRQQLVFRDATGDPSHTQVVFSRPAEVRGASLRWAVELAPGEEWTVTVGILPSTASPDASLVPRTQIEDGFGREQAHVRESLAAWELRLPQLYATWEPLQGTFSQSVADLAALRLRQEDGHGQLPAAGVPWFMTVFGRDTIITSLQTLLFGPELARTALKVLAELQATVDDPAIDAEPGKIVHELRTGKAGRAWFERYYGTVDATPLFLILLSEVWRWTDDILLVRDLQEPALRALEWIDRYGDRDGDGFVEYERRTERGLQNQSWKDSDDSQRFADGRVARPPIAPCEVQGYVYDAKRRAAELARHVWRDRALADRLDAEADELRRRFDEAFWLEDRGGYYALALDAEKQPVDSLCSNIGHLLWSGIVPSARADAIADRLMAEPLWSGWGVRTMSTDDAAYNPLSYHNGGIWPHDNSLIAWGLIRYGHWAEAQRIARRIYEAAGHFDYQLPEVFAGLRRTETPFPVPYPTAAKPQAWAAGAPVLLLRVLLGLEPEPLTQALFTTGPPEVPAWLRTVRLTGVRAFDRQWNVRMEGDGVEVEEVQ